MEVSRSRLHKVILALFILGVTNLFYNWLTKATYMSGNYLIQNAYILSTGVETKGVINKISLNSDVQVPNNYLATVTFTGSNNLVITKNFRYAERNIKDPEVHVVYNPRNPEIAALKEDAGYFKGTLHGLIIFGFFWSSLYGIIFFVDFIFKRKRKFLPKK